MIFKEGYFYLNKEDLDDNNPMINPETKKPYSGGLDFPIMSSDGTSKPNMIDFGHDEIYMIFFISNYPNRSDYENCKKIRKELETEKNPEKTKNLQELLELHENAIKRTERKFY